MGVEYCEVGRLALLILIRLDNGDLQTGQESEAGFQKEVSLRDQRHDGRLLAAADGPSPVVEREGVLPLQPGLHNPYIARHILDHECFLISSIDFEVVDVE